MQIKTIKILKTAKTQRQMTSYKVIR